MTQIKTFLVNDQHYCIYDNITLLDLIQYFNYKDSLLVVEYNNLICNKTNWNKIQVEDQDKIEILTIVGGG